MFKRSNSCTSVSPAQKCNFPMFKGKRKLANLKQKLSLKTITRKPSGFKLVVKSGFSVCLLAVFPPPSRWPSIMYVHCLKYHHSLCNTLFYCTPRTSVLNCAHHGFIVYTQVGEEHPGLSFTNYHSLSLRTGYTLLC